MRAKALFWLLLIVGVTRGATAIAAVDVGWMQPGVRLWYLGAVDGGGVTSSNAEESHLIDAVVGTDARLVRHSALNHWKSPRPVETETYSLVGMGPCWIHPQRLQGLKAGEYWMGQEITLVVPSTYTYATFPYRLLPIKALFDIKPQRQIVKLSYMMPGFSVGNAYFDLDTGILLYHHALWGANRMFFILGEINYDFAHRTAFAEDGGPHTGFKSFVSEQSLGSSWGVGGGSVIIQSLVETRYGAAVEMRVLSAIAAPGYPAGTGELEQADENYCFFGDVPILRRMDATQAPNFPPEQWNPFGQYLWWWLPPTATRAGAAVTASSGSTTAVQTIDVFDVAMAKTADQPLTVVRAVVEHEQQAVRELRLGSSRRRAARRPAVAGGGISTASRG